MKIEVDEEVAAMKNAIRTSMRIRRRALDAATRKRAAQTLCTTLLARKDVKTVIENFGTVAVYCATPEEIDLGPFIEALRGFHQPLAMPFWDEKAQRYALARYELLTRLVKGPHDILEPAAPPRHRVSAQEIGLWIVPGLAFTANGDRLGYGGGWYDRFLEKADFDAVSLGVGFACQRVDELPVDLHDECLSDVVLV